jgi:hypothetical protein
VDIFHHDLETIKFSFCILYFVYKVSAKFSLTIPSEAAKKARICLMKYPLHLTYCSNHLNLVKGQFLRQSKTSLHFLIPFPNIMMFDWKITKRFLFSCKIGSICDIALLFLI